MSHQTRRQILTQLAGLAGAAAVGSPALGQDVITIVPDPSRPQAARQGLVESTGPASTPQGIEPSTGTFYEPPPVVVEQNISSFRTHDWRTFFGNLNRGAILVDTKTRSLHYWSGDNGTYMIFPTSVPMSPELTKLGRTSVVAKVEGPEWRPTPNMLKRDPSLPSYVGPGPENPLGTHALYLSWKYYRIHGTNDTRKIGRMSSNGCIGLFNEDIQVLFGLAKVGTQVLLI